MTILSENNGYKYKFIMKEKATKENDFVASFLYCFESKDIKATIGGVEKVIRKGIRYRIIVQEFPNNFYAVKFHPMKNKGKNKYNIITNVGEPMRPIVRTCVNVMFNEIKGICKNASFGFLGADTNRFVENKEVNKTISKRRKTLKENESKSNTQRFRIYSTLVSTLISKTDYKHIIDEDISCFVLINNDRLKDNPAYIEDIAHYFELHYDNLFSD